VAREIWLLCAQLDISLQVSHIAGADLTTSADALSRMHLGQPFASRVDSLLSSQRIKLTKVPNKLFTLDTDI
jgi:hypothetical protein